MLPAQDSKYLVPCLRYNVPVSPEDSEQDVDDLDNSGGDRGSQSTTFSDAPVSHCTSPSPAKTHQAKAHFCKLLTIKHKLQVVELRLLKGLSLEKINERMAEQHKTVISHGQLSEFIKQKEILQNMVDAGHGDRINLSGQGRPPSLNDETRAAAIRTIRGSQEEGKRVTRTSAREVLGAETAGEVSKYVATKFFKEHNLTFRSASNTVKVTKEDVVSSLRKFHRACNDTLLADPLVTVDTIVQIDEMATCMSGSLSSVGAKVLVEMDGKPLKTAFVPTCDLDGNKKAATVVGFLATVYIPPLIIFPGEGQLPRAEKARYACPVIFESSGNTTATSYIESVLAHAKKYCPNMRMIVHDSATSHRTEAVKDFLLKHKIHNLVIPSGLTQYVQALDVYFFGCLRANHLKLKDGIVANSPVAQFQKMAANEKRIYLTQVTAKSFQMTYDAIPSVGAYFEKLGYVGIGAMSLVKLPDYTCPPETDEERAARIVRGVEEDRAAAAEKAKKQAKASIITSQSFMALEPRRAPEKKQTTFDFGSGTLRVVRKDASVVQGVTTTTTAAVQPPPSRKRAPLGQVRPREETETSNCEEGFEVKVVPAPPFTVRNMTRGSIIRALEKLKIVAEVASLDTVFYHIATATLALAPTTTQYEPRGVLVSNTQLSHRGGTHWVAIFFNTGGIVVVDSKVGIRSTEHMVATITATASCPVKLVELGMQHDTTSCGGWAMIVALVGLQLVDVDNVSVWHEALGRFLGLNPHTEEGITACIEDKMEEYALDEIFGLNIL